MELVKDGPVAEQDEEVSADHEIIVALRSPTYVAFRSLPGRSKLRLRLLLAPKKAPWDWLGNAALWRIRAKPDGTQIALTYHTATVLIEGEGLMEAAFSVDRCNCLFLQEFDPARHDPVQRGQPVITSMRFFYPDDEAAKSKPPDKHAAKH